MNWTKSIATVAPLIGLTEPLPSTGNGSGFLKIMERLMRGVWTPAAVEVMQPTL